MCCTRAQTSSLMSSFLWPFKTSSISAKTSKIYSILSIKYFINALIAEYHTFDQSWTDQDKCSLHQSIRARRYFGVIFDFLGTMYEAMLYCWRIRLIVELLVDRLIFVLPYRTKSVKEFVSSQICSSLMSRVCRFVVFFGRPAPGLVATVPYLSNLRIVWRVQRRKIFSCREILCARVQHITAH